MLGYDDGNLVRQIAFDSMTMTSISKILSSVLREDDSLPKSWLTGILYKLTVN